MITKITNIRNFAVFDDFVWDKCVTDANGEPMKFGKLNILYGHNYSGKTTLSRIFRAIETHSLPEKYDDPQFEAITTDGIKITQDTIGNSDIDVRVFNEDFVRKNLRFLIDPLNEIEPFAILSTKVDVVAAIEVLEAEIGSNEIGNVSGLYKQRDEDSAKATEAKLRHKSATLSLNDKLSRKAIDRKTGIKYNSERFGNQNYNISELNKDINSVLAPGYVALNSEQKAEFERNLSEREKTASKLDLNDHVSETYMRDNIEKSAELVSRKLGTSDKIQKLLRNSALNMWARQGKELHEGQNICAFCGNTITRSRWDEINAHFDEESKRLESEIDSYVDHLCVKSTQLHEYIIDRTNFYAKYHDTVDTLAAEINKAIEEYCYSLDHIVEQLRAKKANVAIDIDFDAPKDNSSYLLKIVDKFNAIVDQNNNYSHMLSSAKSKAREALRLQEVSDFCVLIGYCDERRKIDKLAEAVKQLDQKEKSTMDILRCKQRKLHDYKRLINDEEEGAKRVNKYLNDYFGHSFISLQAEEVAEGEKRIRFRIIRNDKPAHYLSEGECSLISFCYFVAKLDDVDTSGKKPIIWIDDPISSLDGNHIFFVYSLLLAEVVKKGIFSQLFLSTHNLDFLKYLIRLNAKEYKPSGKIGSMEKHFFIVNRYGLLSKIERMPKYLKNNATEYNFLFSKILECSKIENIDDSNVDRLLDFGNTARRFLEIHLFFKFPDSSDDKIHRFFSNDEIAAELINRLCNEGSHGSLEQAQRISELSEAISAAKKIVDKLKEDREQYSALLASVDDAISV